MNSFSFFKLKSVSIFFGSWRSISQPIIWAISFCFYLPISAEAQTNETLSSGSFIIDMGASPQSFNNGLKPYGLVYDLLKNHYVPIKWVIKNNKLKDSADFIYNGIAYKGGPFVIPAAYRTAAVNARISYWQSVGVVGTTTTSSINVPVFTTLKTAPVWTLDDKNGKIAEEYLIDAGIPSTAYNWLEPAQLGRCNDIFVMPHADPEWETHANLLTWNRDFKGAIWAACHAVSVLEAISNPSIPSQKLNFLSTTGLIDFSDHHDASPPYNYFFPTDPFMQFMGKLDNAVTNGSEQVFLPLAGGSWRSSTRVAIYDSTQQDVPSESNGLAAIVAYGKAFGDSTRGNVLYEAAHDHNKGGTIPERVAAQRIMFNFSFASANERAILPTIGSVPDTMIAGSPINLSLTLPVGQNIANYSVQWQSTCGGSFSPLPNQANTIFNPPSVSTATNCVIKVIITDDCGRVFFEAKTTVICADVSVAISANNSTVCVGGSVVLTATLTNGTNDISYQWQSSPDSLAWSDISGATATTFAPSSSIPSAMRYRVLIFKPTSICGDAVSNNIAVTVIADPSVSIATATSGVCVGVNVTLNATPSGGTGICSIQWQSSPDGATWSNIAGATTNNFVTPPLPLDATQTRYRAQVTCTGNGCCN